MCSLLCLLAAALAPLTDERPPEADLSRFPALSVVWQELGSNRLYREHLESRLPVERHRAWLICAALAETDRLYDVWDALRWAHLYGHAGTRRDMLGRLRELLGPCAYYAGRMPPACPLWHFVLLD